MGWALSDNIWTHAELVARAVRWLKVTQRCGIVWREHYMFNEVPDALGYRRAYSLVVECKVSRSDFLRDLKKPSRRSYAERPALKCWYMVPEAFTTADAIVLEQADLPDGWGLLVVDGRGQVREAIAPRAAKTWNDDRTPDQLRREIERLYCDIRRYHAQGLHYETIQAQRERIRSERLTARCGQGVL